jgi:hypothetical protein
MANDALSGTRTDCGICVKFYVHEWAGGCWFLTRGVEREVDVRRAAPRGFFFQHGKVEVEGRNGICSVRSIVTAKAASKDAGAEAPSRCQRFIWRPLFYDATAWSRQREPLADVQPVVLQP